MEARGLSPTNNVQVAGLNKQYSPVLSRYGKIYGKSKFEGVNPINKKSIKIETGQPDLNNRRRQLNLFGPDWNNPPIKTLTGTAHSPHYGFEAELTYPKNSKLVGTKLGKNLKIIK